MSESARATPAPVQALRSAVCTLGSMATVTTDIPEDASRRAGLPDGLFRDEPQPTNKASREIPSRLVVVLVLAAIVLAWLVTR